MQADSDSFMSPFLLPLLPPIAQESHPVCPSSGSHELGASCLVYPIPSSLSSPHASFPTPCTPKTCPPWPCSSHVPAGHPRGQRLVSHHLLALPPPLSLLTVRKTAHTTTHQYVYKQKHTHKLFTLAKTMKTKHHLPRSRGHFEHFFPTIVSPFYIL